MPYLFHAGYAFQSDPEERLKLYLCRKVAEFHKWELSARNTDHTCRVTLTIPKSSRERTEAIVTTTMELFVEFISDLLGLNTCSVMISDELTGELTIKSARGLDDSVIKRTRIRYGDRIAGWVALEGKPLLIEDIETDPRFGRKNVSQYNTKSLLSVPLKVKGKVIGVLNLNNKLSAEPFTARDLDVAEALSARVSHFIEQLYSGEYGEPDFRQFLTSFYSLIDAERRYHKKKGLLPDLMVSTMEKLGASEEDKNLSLYVSMIYDLGLVLVDESILKKKTKLSPSEARTLKVHPYTTVNLLKSFEFSEDVKSAILHHHERFDGTGYPDGLKGDEIPFVSRVLSVVDAFCAMTEERPYRKTFTREGALEEIRKYSGTLYDPRVVDAFEGVVSSL
jgi:putative methionine-R-sulfoxide reductase with GAF domain